MLYWSDTNIILIKSQLTKQSVQYCYWSVPYSACFVFRTRDILCFATDVCDVTFVKQKKKLTHLKRGLSLITKKYKPSVRKYDLMIITLFNFLCWMLL